MTGQQYRAAILCKATNDVRYYLDGLYISSDNNEVVATNGHIMYTADIEAGDTCRNLIFQPAKIPANVHEVKVQEYDDTNVLVVAYSSKGTEQHICKIVDGKYPDYKMITSSTNTDQSCNKIGYDSKYLALLPRIFNKDNVLIHMPSANVASKVTSVDHDNYGSLILMPVKIS